MLLAENFRVAVANELTDELLQPACAAFRPGVYQDVAGSEGKVVQTSGIPNGPLHFARLARS
jgi:hypothetical protein